MPNFTPLPAYPYGSKAPFPHGDANDASEKIVKSHNADDGSNHAPTGTSAWSGSFGFGWEFADAFPFTGEVSVDGDGLTIGAASSGFVSLGALVALDVFGPTTFKTGGSSLVQWQSGATATFLLGSTFTLATGATMNLTGAVALRGQFTVTASGGPGSIVIQNGTTNTCAGLFFFLNNGEARFQSGSFITGAVHVTSGSVVLDTGAELTIGDPITLDPVVPWTRWATRVAATSYDAGAPQAVSDKFSPLFATPSLFTLGGSADPVVTIFEFQPPPDGALMTTVTVKSIYNGIPLSTLVVATYEVVKFQYGLTADPVSISNIVDDTHATNGSDWDTVKTVSVAIDADTKADLAYRYGLRVISSRYSGGGTCLEMFFDAKLTGTTDVITGA